ncbi:hypothetical protein Bca4012_020435 [Brassica carinata]
MNWFAERRNVLNHGSGRLTPRGFKIVEANFEKSGGLHVSRIKSLEFDVKEKNRTSFHVNLTTNSCSSFSFHTLMIPCAHAITAAITEKISMKSLVSDVYNLDNLASAYTDAIYPISDAVRATELTVNGGSNNLEIFLPASRRPPGKPRKSRICPLVK